jgi:hypothetical protein
MLGVTYKELGIDYKIIIKIYNKAFKKLICTTKLVEII